MRNDLSTISAIGDARSVLPSEIMLSDLFSSCNDDGNRICNDVNLIY